jgi:hypothetical protein
MQAAGVVLRTTPRMCVISLIFFDFWNTPTIRDGVILTAGPDMLFCFSLG